MKKKKKEAKTTFLRHAQKNRTVQPGEAFENTAIQRCFEIVKSLTNCKKAVLH
jgi:hypothetical protein